jgi:hypothetical protein
VLYHWYLIIWEIISLKELSWTQIKYLILLYYFNSVFNFRYIKYVLNCTMRIFYVRPKVMVKSPGKVPAMVVRS